MFNQLKLCMLSRLMTFIVAFGGVSETSWAQADSVTASDYEGRRSLIAEAFEKQNDRLEKILIEWNRLKILEAAANKVGDSHSDYVGCVFAIRSRDILYPDCETSAASLLTDLTASYDAVAKSNDNVISKNSFYERDLNKVEQRDRDSLKERREAIEEQIKLYPIGAKCNGETTLHADDISKRYLKAILEGKFRTALQLSSESKRKYTIARYIINNCPEFSKASSVMDIQSEAVYIAFAEAVFEPKLLASMACTSRGPDVVDKSAEELLAQLCVATTEGVSTEDVRIFQEWLAKFIIAVEAPGCRQWVNSEFSTNPSVLASLRYTGLGRRLGQTDCGFPAIPEIFQKYSKKEIDFEPVVSSILALANDGRTK